MSGLKAALARVAQRLADLVIGLVCWALVFWLIGKVLGWA